MKEAGLTNVVGPEGEGREEGGTVRAGAWQDKEPKRGGTDEGTEGSGPERAGTFKFGLRKGRGLYGWRPASGWEMEGASLTKGGGEGERVSGGGWCRELALPEQGDA